MENLGGENREGQTRTFTKSETIRGLRVLQYTAALWGGWSQIAVTSGAVFTGFALFLGAEEHFIGTMVSLVSLMGFLQLISFFVSRNIPNKKFFVIFVGFAEICIKLFVIFIPLFLPKGTWIFALAVMNMGGVAMGNILGPVFNSWFASIVPEEVRARYIAKRTIIRQIIAMVSGFGAGLVLDAFSKGYRGFFILFMFGIATGVGGYISLFKVPFNEIKKSQTPNYLKMLSTPFKNRDFTIFLFFYISYIFAVGIANPFYNIFMIKRLEISYSTIAIFNNISMLSLIVGFKLWGGFIDRYGSKPIIEMLLIPSIVIPLLWILNSKGDFYLIPFIMVLNGLIVSGISIGVSSLLYKLIPQEEENTNFFASWSSTVNLSNAAGPAFGGFLIRHFETLDLNIYGVQISNVKIAFIVSAFALILPNLIIRYVKESKAVTPKFLLTQMARGNPLSFALNLFMFSRTRAERRKAQAARAMGRSRSPMAVDTLVAALDDANPDVRSQAAKGLGDAGHKEAAIPLIEKLSDDESDIREEAAEALGKIKSPLGIVPLLKALQDPDRRIKMSAIRALGEIGGEKAKERLFEEFSGVFDREVFPTLVESLSEIGDLRAVEPTIMRLGRFKSIVIRFQLLNCICRNLGLGNQFYELISREDLERVNQITLLLRRIRRNLLSYKAIADLKKKELNNLLEEMMGQFEAERYTDLSNLLLRAVDILEETITDKVEAELSESNIVIVAKSVCQAVRVFWSYEGEDGFSQESVMFLVLCLLRLADILTGGGTQKSRRK